MTTVFLKVISGILRQHEELLMIQREFFTSPTVQEKTTGVSPEQFLKQQMQAQTTARFAG